MSPTKKPKGIVGVDLCLCLRGLSVDARCIDKIFRVGEAVARSGRHPSGFVAMFLQSQPPGAVVGAKLSLTTKPYRAPVAGSLAARTPLDQATKGPVKTEASDKVASSCWHDRHQCIIVCHRCNLL